MRDLKALAKLAILDKDGTITTSASGATFPQHPQDQKLLPGVKEAVARLVADGYTLVIASNQGGCDAFTVEVSNAKVGMVWLDSSVLFDPSDSKPIKLDSVFQHDTGVVELSGWSDNGNGQRLYSGSRILDKGTQIKCCWKTIDDAIAEMHYCMELLPSIKTAFFCPDFAGDDCIIVSGSDASSRYGKLFRPYRKPHPGLLKAVMMHESLTQPSQVVMIGDQECDFLAAKAAGIPFLDAAEWRNAAVIPA